jgi:hypothetical protein
VVFISGDPFISGFSELVQRVLWLSVQIISGDDGDVSFSSVYFGTPKSDLWLLSTSDGCDQFRGRNSVQWIFI